MTIQAQSSTVERGGAAAPLAQVIPIFGRVARRHEPNRADFDSAEEYTEALRKWEARADELLEQADQEIRADAKRRRDANRRARYERRRPRQYANASYAELDRRQNPRNRVATWWDHGSRALFLAGPSRTGKTTAAYAIANHVHEQGKWVEVWTAAGLWKALRAGEEVGEPNAEAYALACDLLVIDDLGREKPTDAWIERLQEILNTRLGSGGRLIVTANAVGDLDAAYDELIDKYGDPLIERILDGAGIVLVSGPKRRNIVLDW